MKLKEIITKRCSIRSYSPAMIAPETLEAILEAGRLAPSACNYQPWIFLIVESPEGREKVQSCYPREWFRTAPLYLILCGDHAKSWKRAEDQKDHLDIDLAIAAEHLCLAAAELGLGSCWVCNFDTVRCKELFGLPQGVEPIVILSLGYPADEALFEKTPKKRKSLGEIVIREHF